MLETVFYVGKVEKKERLLRQTCRKLKLLSPLSVVPILDGGRADRGRHSSSFYLHTSRLLDSLQRCPGT